MKSQKKDSVWPKVAVCVGALIAVGGAFEVYEKQVTPSAKEQKSSPPRLRSTKPYTLTFAGQDNYPKGWDIPSPSGNSRKIMARFRFRSDDPLPSDLPFDLQTDCGDGVPRRFYSPTVSDKRELIVDIPQGYGKILYKPHFDSLSPGVGIVLPEKTNLQRVPPPIQLIPDSLVKPDPRITARLEGPEEVGFELSKDLAKDPDLCMRVSSWTYSPGWSISDWVHVKQGALRLSQSFAIDQTSVDVGFGRQSQKPHVFQGMLAGAKVVKQGSQGQLILTKETTFKDGDWDMTFPPQRRALIIDSDHVTASLRISLRYKGTEIPMLSTPQGFGPSSERLASGSSRQVPASWELTGYKFVTVDGKSNFKLSTPVVATYKDSQLLPGHDAGAVDFDAIKVEVHANTTVTQQLFQATIPIVRG